MEDIEKAFSDARRYENYNIVKTIADGYLIWAAMIFIGSLLSFLIEIFSIATGVNKDYIGAAIGSIWIFILSFAMLFAFRLDPKIKTQLVNSGNFDRSTSRKIAIGWGLSFFIGFTIGYIIGDIYNVKGYNIGILIAIALGNIQIYIFNNSAKISLFVGILILLPIPLLFLYSEVFQTLIIGYIISIPYFLAGAYLIARELPKTLE